jgi:nicotinamide-nucleotide amidase
MQQASILTIGDEILLGQIQDTNSTWLSQILSDLGIDVVLKLTVGDSRETILDAFQIVFQRTDIVIITGGLGPTKDDLTKGLLAEWFHDTLEIRNEAFDHLSELLKKRGREINELVAKQAELPTKATYLHNEVGTAPGMWFSENGKIAIALPGVPYEMKQLIKDEVIPRFRTTLKLDFIRHRFIRTVGVPETFLAQKIDEWEQTLPTNLKLAYLPGGGQVKLRLTGRGNDQNQLEAVLDQFMETLLPLIHENVYATEDIELEQVFFKIWQEKKSLIYLNDLLTKGRLLHLLISSGIPLEKIKTEPSDNLNGTALWLSINGLETETEFMQRITVQFQIKGKKTEGIKELRPFPKPEINQNMLSLWTLNMARLMLIDNFRKK